MKTPEEWLDKTEPPLYGSAINKWIEAIQKDAFDAGRVEGIELCMAEIRDRTMYDDKKTAQSIWRLLTNLRDPLTKPITPHA